MSLTGEEVKQVEQVEEDEDEELEEEEGREKCGVNRSLIQHIPSMTAALDSTKHLTLGCYWS